MTNMHNIFILVVGIFLCQNINANSVTGSSPTITEGSALTNESLAPGKLIFEDTFSTFDGNKWSNDGNNKAHSSEFQWYTDNPENRYVKNGVLHIKPTYCNQTEVTKNDTCAKILRICSARISTKESFSFRNGFVEVKAKVPSGDWLFPAIWCMPRDSKYGAWPVSGEIDLMESRGNKNLTDSSGNFVGIQQFGSTLHWGPNSSLDRWKLTHFTKNNDTSSPDFHVYKLVWTPDSLGFYVDDEEVGIIAPGDGGFWEMGNFDSEEKNPWTNGTKLAPFDQQFYLILNLAVGGTSFFSDKYINQGGKPWKNSSPNASCEFWEGRDQWLPTWNLPSDDSHFLIDYVRVWAL